MNWFRVQPRPVLVPALFRTCPGLYLSQLCSKLQNVSRPPALLPGLLDVILRSYTVTLYLNAFVFICAKNYMFL